MVRRECCFVPWLDEFAECTSLGFFCDMVLSKYFICINKSFIGLRLVVCAGGTVVVHVHKQDVGSLCFAFAFHTGGNWGFVKWSVQGTA